MRSCVPCAMPSRRHGSYSTGRMRRSCDAPMFFIARTVAAMFTWSCGSYSTTRRASSRDSGIGDDKGDETGRVVTVATKIDELALRPGTNQLAAAAFPAAWLFIDDVIHR